MSLTVKILEPLQCSFRCSLSSSGGKDCGSLLLGKRESNAQQVCVGGPQGGFHDKHCKAGCIQSFWWLLRQSWARFFSAAPAEGWPSSRVRQWTEPGEQLLLAEDHRMSHTAAWKLPLRPTHQATKDCPLKRAAKKSAAHIHVPASAVPPLRHGHNAGLLLAGEPGWRALVAPLPSRHHLSLLPSRSELLVRAASPGVLRVKGPEGGGQALDVAVALDEGAEGRHAVAHKVVG